MIISEIKLYELLKAKFGKDEAEAFVEVIDSTVGNKVNEHQQIYKEANRSLRDYLEKSFATKEDLALTRNELLSKIANGQTETIKWMFIFWIGQNAVLIGLITLFFKK